MYKMFRDIQLNNESNKPLLLIPKILSFLNCIESQFYVVSTPAVQAVGLWDGTFLGNKIFQENLSWGFLVLY